MNYVKSLDLFGVDVKQIPSITGSGAPTTATEGAVGCLYMNTDNGDMYKCTAVTDDSYTWVKLNSGSGGSGGSVELDTTLTKEGKAADAKAVGDRIGDIETALDEIHAYAQALISGGGV